MGREREAGFPSFALQPFHDVEGQPEMNLDETRTPWLALCGCHFWTLSNSSTSCTLVGGGVEPDDISRLQWTHLTPRLLIIGRARY